MTDLKAIKDQRDFPPCISCQGQRARCPRLYPLSSLTREKHLSLREATTDLGVAISKMILKTKDGRGWEK